MKILTTCNGNKSVVVYFDNKKAIASFPAKLNQYKIPSFKEVAAILKGNYLLSGLVFG